MKTKLISTRDYLLLIDEEAETKPNKYALNVASKEVYKTSYSYRNLDKITGARPVVAYYPLTKEAKELDLPLLPNPFKDKHNVEELAKIKFAVDMPSKFTATQIWMDGYKTAQSSNKQFSLEDIEKALEHGWFRGKEHGIRFGTQIEGEDRRKDIKQYLQSLSTQQLPKEFIPEIKEVSKYSFKDNSGVKHITFKGLEIGDILIAKDAEKGTGGDFLPFPMNLIEKDKEYKVKEISSFGFYTVPWIIDEDGNHHIPDFDNFTLKNKTGLKTITNSEGKHELVGTYKY